MAKWIFLTLALATLSLFALGLFPGEAKAEEIKVTFYWPKVYENQEVTMYTASKDETDGEQNITADGSNLSKVQNVAACPSSVPFGSFVTFDGKWYVCHDRMAARYRKGGYWDFLAKTKKEAFAFGRKKGQRITVFIAEKS